MTFFNNYKKTTNSVFLDATQIGDFIYAIGKALVGGKYQGLILKVDLNGRVLWEKVYAPTDGASLQFEKVVAFSNGDLFVAGAAGTSSQKVLLTRITADGRTLWQKYTGVSTFSAYHIKGVHLVNGSQDKFYVVIGTNGSTTGGGKSLGKENIGLAAPEGLEGGKTIQGKSVGIGLGGPGGGGLGGPVGGSGINPNWKYTELLLISDSGTLLSQSGFNSHDIFGTASDGNQLLLCGSATSNNNIVGGCFVFDQRFQLVNKFAIAPQQTVSKSVLLNVAFQGRNLILQGGMQDQQRQEYNFMAVIPMPNNPTSGSFPGKILPSGRPGQMIPTTNGIYFNFVTDTLPNGDVSNLFYKLDERSNTLRGQQINLPTTLSLQQVNEQNAILHGSDASLLSLDTSFNSCKSTNPHASEALNTNLRFASTTDYNLLSVQFLLSNTALQVQNMASQVDEICPSTGGGNDGVEINDLTVLQSSYLHLQAAGSTGQDSTRGIHLRWLFRDVLGDKHLPKGDAALTTHNFNKPNDVVRLYRAPYQKIVTTLSFTEVPDEIDDANATWIYRYPGNRELYVYFRNTSKYNELRANNALASGQYVSAFVNNYGGNVIEVENKKEQFFAVEFTIDEDEDVSRLLAETLSIEDNELVTTKAVSARNAFTFGIDTELRLTCENGRSVRLKSEGATLEAIRFEFYHDLIAHGITNNSWQKIGDYALTVEDQIAFERLEPTPGTVHQVWKRYQDDAYVNVNNYQDKWKRNTESWDRNIKQVVSQYLKLSNQADNPTATQQVSLDDGGDLEVSNLDLLNLASYDYHIARMLGLGCLDTDAGIMTGSYVYIISYTTLGDLEDGQGARELQHLTMSLPTTIQDQRLPLPVHLRDVVPGAFFGSENNGQKLTDEEGYTQTGESRYVSIYAQEQPQDFIEASFYQSSDEFSAADYTSPIYAGLEYGTRSGQWIKPELAHDSAYKNVAANGLTNYAETRPLQLPTLSQALFVHRKTTSGTHYYRAYGINVFSRATASNEVKSIVTTIKPKTNLLPPSEVNTLLIRLERPLLLTSESEQMRLQAIGGHDKTLIRLTFDYHTYQDLITRSVPSDASLSNSELLNGNTVYPDSQEVFAHQAEVFFRNQVPHQISGKVTKVEDHPTNELLSIVSVDDYYMASVGKTLSPQVAPGTEGNYIGGTFALGKQQHLIQDVTIEAGKPVFTLYKKEIGDALFNNLPSANADHLQAIEITGDGLFMVVENMQNISSWGNHNPVLPKITLGDSSWSIHREIIETQNSDGSTTRQIEKTRGIWNQNATVAQELEEVTQTDANGDPMYDNDGQVLVTMQHRGLYKITLNGQQLAEHSQQNVEWFRGIVRIFTQGSVGTGLPQKTRKVLKVIRIENVDTAQDVVVYAYDSNFSSETSYDPVQTGSNISVNFYPGYKVYLYRNSTHHLDESHLLPISGEGTRYSIFGLRSVHSQHTSKMSVPSPMFAQEMVAAETPEQPLGSLYASRPDFFGRATYTFTTQYTHQPHGVLFYRANDEILLHAIYEKSTVRQIRADLQLLGGNDETYLANRWENFLNFEALATDGNYKSWDNYRFPHPDKVALFKWARDISTSLGQTFIPEPEWGHTPVGDDRLLNFVKGAIYNAFVPLTRVPVLYQHINGGNYEPVNKKQVIRDKNGYVLAPNHPDFDMAPMMKVVGTAPPKTQFTDFNLDGTSNNLYFYGVKELDTQMKMGDFSPFLGPIKLVNSNPPEAPEVKRIIPKLENVVLGTTPSIQVEVNAYPAVQNIRKLNIYRAFSKLEAQSVRTMQLVETIDLEANALLDESTWQIEDTFDDLDEVPYGDGLFYRVTAARRIEYAHKGNANDVVVEFTPSQASKILGTLMVEVTNPPTPVLSYTADELNTQAELPNVVLRWEKTCYKGKYHLYKMNNKGNWVKIYELANLDNQPTMQVPLQDTDLNTDRLPIQGADNALIYHHFKLVAENTSGLLSNQEEILTVYSEATPPSYHLNFNGNNAYLESQPGFVQWDQSQAFTMQFFVKDLAHTAGSGIIHNPLFSSLPNGSGGGLTFGFRNADFIVSLQANSSKFNSRLFSRGLPFSEITHVTVSYDGSGLADGFTLYLNGIEQVIIQTNNKLGTLEIPQTTSFTLFRGYSWVGGINYAQGKIKNFSIVDYQKTDAEILSDFNAGTQSVGTGAYLLAYDFNIDPSAQSAIIPGLSNSPDLNLFGGSFELTP